MDGRHPNIEIVKVPLANTTKLINHLQSSLVYLVSVDFLCAMLNARCELLYMKKLLHGLNNIITGEDNVEINICRVFCH